ncbi:hypothetical protein ACH5RR_000357 [Cinchona calisaya]|uniref:MSP domain-containing protein n=1 Tax=Cinchona calisaya TaxID=153742 RepID=A0ABD3B0X9_9GENT
MDINGSGVFLGIYPAELKFLFELKKQSSCSVQLTNRTNQYVAFKVKTTNPRKYSVRPNSGVILPGSTSNVTVTMQAQREMPPDMQCKDKFLIQSGVVSDGTTVQDINQRTFDKVGGKIVGEFKLRVAYIPANPPSPVPEESEEDSSPGSSTVDDEGWPMISKMMEENQKLYYELKIITEEVRRTQARRISLFFVLLIGLADLVLGQVLIRNSIINLDLRLVGLRWMRGYRQLRFGQFPEVGNLVILCNIDSTNTPYKELTKAPEYSHDVPFESSQIKMNNS